MRQLTLIAPRPEVASVLLPPEAAISSPAADGPEAFVWRCGKATLSARELAALHDAGAALSPAVWGRVPWLARAHGLAPLVFKHTALATLLPHMPPEIVADLRRAYATSLVHNRRLQIELGHVLHALTEHGVEVMPLKGVTLAARYYPEIALRPVSDIDLLVRRHQLNGCLRALRQVGFSPSPGHGRALSFKVLYNLELRYLKQDGLCVELHTGLARLPAYNAALSIARIWERAEPIQVGGWPARYLSPVDELRYLSLHYAVPHRAERMLWLVDIAELIRARAAEWDWEAFVGETVALGLAAPLAVALGRARELLGLDIPAEVTAGLTAAAATPRERRTWQAAHAPLSDAGRFGGHLRALRGPVEQLAFIGGAATVAARKAHRRVSRGGRR